MAMETIERLSGNIHLQFGRRLQTRTSQILREVTGGKYQDVLMDAAVSYTHLYHPHAEYHHIKKENIGLIEVMGLAVLPARLKEELELLAEYILEGKDISSNEKIEKHAAWVAEFLPKYDKLDKNNIQDVLRKEVGNVFVHVLEDAGVYKCTVEGREAFMRFINKL